MEKLNERNIQIRTEMDDAREFAELCEKLSQEERKQVKSIIIGIQIGKETSLKTEVT